VRLSADIESGKKKKAPADFQKEKEPRESKEKGATGSKQRRKKSLLCSHKSTFHGKGQGAVGSRKGSGDVDEKREKVHERLRRGAAHCFGAFREKGGVGGKEAQKKRLESGGKGNRRRF